MRFNPFKRKEKKAYAPIGTILSGANSRGGFQVPKCPPSDRSVNLLVKLPSSVLTRIFILICPHTQDESYETADVSIRGSGCTLCDLRDLSHCAQVSRTWRSTAIKVLYHSVRIDAVHYCKLEGFLADKRKKKGLDINGIPEDPAHARLQLFRRTVRDDPTRLGKLVKYLKLTYVLRESSQQELAQALAVLPNLKYVDLPEGLFADESAYAVLRLEVQARCPDLRKMTYRAGSERSLGMLAGNQVWLALEVLELNRLDVAANSMRAVLGSLRNLKALKVSEMHGFSDETFAHHEGYPPMPPLEELVLKDTPRVTTAGLISYLAWEETQSALKVLTIHDTGVPVSRLQEILTMATSLQILAVQATVTETFPVSLPDGQHLRSPSLQTLRYEVSAPSSGGAWGNIVSGYYSHVANSIRSGNLPQLQRVYVDDDTFPEQLQGQSQPSAGIASSGESSNRSLPSKHPSILVTPAENNVPANSMVPAFAPPVFCEVSHVPLTNRFSSTNPFSSPQTLLAAPPPSSSHMLEIFTKSKGFGKWNFARVNTFNRHHANDPRSSGGGGGGRPGSVYGLGNDVRGMGWGGCQGRRSVMVGNGADGFLELSGKDKFI